MIYGAIDFVLCQKFESLECGSVMVGLAQNLELCVFSGLGFGPLECRL